MKNLKLPMDNSLEVEHFNVDTFSSSIERALDLKSKFASREISKSDYPELIKGFTSHLLKACGVFYIKGYHRPVDLSLWYDHDALTEEFDDLLLEFKDYLLTNKGLEEGTKYTLIRFNRPDKFLMIKGIIENDTSIQFGKDNDEVVDCFKDMLTQLLKSSFSESKLLDTERRDDFLRELFGHPEVIEMFKRHINGDNLGSEIGEF